MILCEFGPDGKPVLFRDPREVLVVTGPEDVASALDHLEARRRQGAWIAGYLSYELGYALEPVLAREMPAGRRTPLMAFAVHDAPEPAPPLPASGAARLAPLKPMISQQDYAAAFARTRDYIAAGDCYQINLTFPIGSRLISGSALQLYAALAVRHRS